MTKSIFGDRARRTMWAMAMLCLFGANASAGEASRRLHMGASLDELRRLGPVERTGAYEYRARFGRLLGDDFQALNLVVTPMHGLCEYVAWGVPIHGDRDGEQLRSLFDATLAALGDRYGDAEIRDAQTRESLWSDARDWRRGLQEGSWTLQATWRRGNHELPDQLASVRLVAEPVGDSSGRIWVGYEFANGADCRAWVHAKRRGRL